MFHLFARGRPVLQMLGDSGLAPKCDIPLLRTHLRSCRTVFTESKKRSNRFVNDPAAKPDHSQTRLGLTPQQPLGRSARTLHKPIRPHPALAQDGPDSRYVKVIATCKHLVAYSIEDTPPDRHRFDAVLSVQDLMDTYLPAFRACVLRGEAKAVMCSYNKVNGVPACAHEGLLNGLLRRKWGWDGAVVSDCGAVEEIMTTQRYTTGEHNTVAASLEAGDALALPLPSSRCPHPCPKDVIERLTTIGGPPPPPGPRCHSGKK